MVVFVCVFVDNSTLIVSVAAMRPSWVKKALFLRVDLALSSSKDGRVGMVEIEFFPACWHTEGWCNESKDGKHQLSQVGANCT